MIDIEQYLRDNKLEMPEEGQFLVETNACLCNVEGSRSLSMQTGIADGCH